MGLLDSGPRQRLRQSLRQRRPPIDFKQSRPVCPTRHGTAAFQTELAPIRFWTYNIREREGPGKPTTINDEAIKLAKIRTSPKRRASRPVRAGGGHSPGNRERSVSPVAVTSAATHELPALPGDAEAGGDRRAGHEPSAPRRTSAGRQRARVGTTVCLDRGQDLVSVVRGSVRRQRLAGSILGVISGGEGPAWCGARRRTGSR